MTRTTSTLFLPTPAVQRVVIFVVAALFVVAPSCRAREAAATLRGVGPVGRLRRDDTHWRAAWRSSGGDVAWRDGGDVHLDAPAGERVVTVGLPRHFASLWCEESRQTIDGFLQGRCALQPTVTQSHSSSGGVFFSYRVAHGENRADVVLGADRAPFTCKLYEGSADDDGELEVGTITYEEEEKGEMEGGVDGASVTIYLQINVADTAKDRLAWLPRALKLTGMSVETLARRDLRKRAASSFVERWGYPLLAVVILYVSLDVLSWVVTRRKLLVKKFKRA